MPLDGKGSISSYKQRPIEVIAPRVMERQPVKTPLQTGIKAIDSMIPIDAAESFVIGDRQTGKTAIAIDTILNQRDQPNRPICIYVAIGPEALLCSFRLLRHCRSMELWNIPWCQCYMPVTHTAASAPYSGARSKSSCGRVKMSLLCTMISQDMLKHTVSFLSVAETSRT